MIAAVNVLFGLLGFIGAMSNTPEILGGSIAGIGGFNAWVFIRQTKQGEDIAEIKGLLRAKGKL